MPPALGFRVGSLESISNDTPRGMMASFKIYFREDRIRLTVKPNFFYSHEKIKKDPNGPFLFLFAPSLAAHVHNSWTHPSPSHSNHYIHTKASNENNI